MTELSERPVRLAQRLRAETRVAHVEAEQALDLDSHLCDLQAYGALLLDLYVFYTAAEKRLAQVDSWGDLSPTVDPVSRQRTSLLVRDLDGLGLTAPLQVGATSRLPDLNGLAAALGCLYVIEGSRLGGRVIARQVRATLGGDVPVAFFSSGERALADDWRTLQHALDAFGAGAGEGERVMTVSAALETFAAFSDCLSRQVRPS